MPVFPRAASLGWERLLRARIALAARQSNGQGQQGSAIRDSAQIAIRKPIHWRKQQKQQPGHFQVS